MDEISKQLRMLVIDALEGGGRGHIGSSFSLIEILRVLYDDILEIDPNKPNSLHRDRLILSKGHGCLALYATLAYKGFFSKEELLRFCKFDSFLGGHPELGHTPGIEASTGSLGHGLPIASGIAYSLKLSKLSNKVFVIVGDGELQEGSNWETILASSSLHLDNLVLIVDYNKLQSYGNIESIWNLEPLRNKFESFNWTVDEVDGHNVSDLRSVFNFVNKSTLPRVVIAHTIKGKGISFAENKPEWHHKVKIDKELSERLRKEVLNA